MEKELEKFEKLIFKYRNKTINQKGLSFNEYLYLLHSEVPYLFQNKSISLSNEEKQIFLNFLKYYKKALSS
ncbi:hypothetical protein [Arcobacter arenosus]|uniref:hypothetical protein n=1 Tax=Arcobacter arenosus TaxID=2576037 RepID=UPI003BAA2B4A